MEPDDSIVIENWWVEVKHRSDTLKKATVQSIVLNATGRKEVDVFAIFTNNTISNSTLDWVKEFQDTHAKPRIVIWQKHDVERILRKCPRTVGAFFPESLSLPEKLESIQERFWNNLSYPTINEIEHIWANFHSLTWDSAKLLPLIVADTAIDGVNIRKWGMVADDELIAETLILGLLNFPFLAIRYQKQGQKYTGLQQGLEYLLQIALLRLDLDKVLDLLVNMHEYTSSPTPFPPEFKNLVLNPIVHNIYNTLLRSCTQDCERFGSDWAIKKEQGESFYFHRFSNNSTKEDDDTEPFVIISTNTKKCKIDLVAIGIDCPLTDDVDENQNLMDEAVLKKFLSPIQSVIKKRAQNIQSS